MVLFLCSCDKKESLEDNLSRNEVGMIEIQDSLKHLDSLEKEYYHELWTNDLAQRNFFNLFFEQRDNVDFSLDEEIAIYAFRGQCTVLTAGKDNCELFIYTRTLPQNKVWSNRCGVMETMTSEQSKKLKSIEDELLLEFERKKGIQKQNFAFFHWSGKNLFSSGKNINRRFEYFLRGDGWVKADVLMFNFFKNEIFIHGCKRHLL